MNDLDVFFCYFGPVPVGSLLGEDLEDSLGVEGVGQSYTLT